MPDRELATRDEHAWTQDQQRIIREQFADGCTDDELAVLLYQAKRRGLDPLLGQIRGIKRWNAQKGREVMAVQTSIDAFRLIADRTGKYGGGPAPEFRFEEDSKGDRDMVCRFTVRKLCGNSEAGWTWLDVTDEARFKEYCGRNKKGHLTRMWHDKPHVMLAKCAESKTLRRAFPEDLGHLFTDDEMQQADNPVVVAAADVTNPEKAEQVARTTVDRMRGGVGMVGEYPQGDAKVLSCADCGARVTYEEPHECQEMRDENQKRHPDRPDPIRTTFYVPDEFQAKRLEMALHHDPSVHADIAANWQKRAVVCTTSDGFNVLCDEIEAAVGLAEPTGGPDGNPAS